MSMLQQDLFLITLESQFRDLFQASKAGKDNTEQRLRAQGFIHAGELLQLCSRQQALQLGDYAYFEEPAFNRLYQVSDE